MDSDAASVMSPMSPVGGSSVKGDSSKVIEVSIGNSEAALGHRKTVEDIVRALGKHGLMRHSLQEKSSKLL